MLAVEEVEMPARAPESAAQTVERLRVAVRGAVQGVGFRPFVYRLATSAGLRGWVNNSAQGVFVEVEGEHARLADFLLRIERERPPRASIQSLEASYLDPVGYQSFVIRESERGGAKTALVLPDIATCPDCLRDIDDPSNRRYQYPFTNCTNCGPRFSIIEALPYDRPATTMRRFEMCADCRAEYEDPLDRRFHAQPNACPACGPRLELWDAAGSALAARDEALRRAAAAVRAGAVLALKGLGGFQLLVDARNDAAVRLLRRRKRREEKPFALMFHALASARELCHVCELEERLLLSPESPIVLLRRKTNQTHPSPITQHSTLLSPSVAPGNPYLGAMLPYTPLHHLLMAELGFPVVATSGNISDEPIYTDERDAFERLEGVADLFLVHDRPIARHVDDSIVRVVAGREMVLRRARGYAPLPVRVNETLPPLVAVGAHQKNAVAAAQGENVFVGQHIGDLDTQPAREAHARGVESLGRLFELRPAALAADAHPDYGSTRFARATNLPVVAVQHHYAHVLSCMAENGLEGPVLGVAWDGTGLGADGTIWGGEFLRVTPDGYERTAHLRTFRLPGGERAAREPRRSALGALYEIYGPALFELDECEAVRGFAPEDLRLLAAALRKGVNAPATSSAGRLFDAAASLAGLRQVARFEGQAAMELEFALEGFETEESYRLRIADCGLRNNEEDGETKGRGDRETARGGGMNPSPPRLPVPSSPRPSHPQSAIRNPQSAIVDWEPMLSEVLADVRAGVPVGVVSAKFHNALVESIVSVAHSAGEERVVLTGGCFQNRYLTERAVRRLREEGFRPYWHQRVPPNDGGIALGQILAAARALRKD